MLHFWHEQITFKPVEVRDVSLQGKTAIVTGANTGVGFQTCRQLLDLGLSKLVLGVRNEQKGRDAAAKLSLGRDLAKDAIEVWLLDHSSYESVIAFAERTRSLERLDLMNLNVGFAPTKRVFNENTGHDEVIQVNYLSNALLAILLLPVAKEKRANQSQPSRITLTSSEVSGWTKFKERTTPGPLLATLDKKEGEVSMADRMFVSKLLGQFFLAKLAAEVAPSVAIINGASPGACHDTEFNRDFDKTFLGAIYKTFLKRAANSSAIGARMMTDAIVHHGEETHGQFLSFQKIVPMSPFLYTEEGKKISEQLWKETMAELSFARVEDILKTLKE
ncbi:short chain dehydrogenase [Hirsutella rhossiliensis]|uniref:Short chain dehydrogenase domain-containing protein n=1 Tax=Hirsutella rhossiliensis TaxID=111463 RepID=A0A9P8N3V6_9HYPO|nr:short chain dehydrogenase domain-containing protein [Hirsutella rhossiliensis]KAH0967883.1 short chain dehydrogenase domain-containing protein [Hirsutella rhossiliensis]